ncbi:mitochondrial carrier domain-containing protein [Cokeromyces recurvatus]|uniref:mitochondrial carrier domain-containing protein n=1 Tax=Cokeromyces recurvatus TaxID=90255 RepID=UPI0022204DF9|nr:mitochondrial carrier domain-containing protein [Cokeromyces recurvatus]KAI7908168.1 mitochondrial carrier domain-containing protein [Cokeromyces recurvatus]
MSTTAVIQQQQAEMTKVNKAKETAIGFIIGGLAACGAVTFTNPWEVVKTRLQLQGELVRAGALSESARPYQHSFQALKVVFQHEGIRGAQRGLSVAYFYQICLNGSRLGLYEPVFNYTVKLFNLNISSTHRNHGGILAAGVFSGAFAGVVGAALGSPLYLIKTRRQSYSPVFKSIGYQHESMNKASILSSLKHIYQTEGIKGLYRGADAAMVRAGVGSAVQMPTYMMGKDILLNRFGLPDTVSTHFATSMFTGVLVCLAMNPFDVISTRMYNQGVDPLTGKGILYNGPVDCFVKLVKIEGVRGLYKGFLAHYLRIGPHTTLMFIFMEQLKKLYNEHLA